MIATSIQSPSVVEVLDTQSIDSDAWMHIQKPVRSKTSCFDQKNKQTLGRILSIVVMFFIILTLILLVTYAPNSKTQTEESISVTETTTMITSAMNTTATMNASMTEMATTFTESMTT
ncbi:hypothetical protein I4U23_015486 [Adineta vaga]|nr:hypothetical protein I4U23_015486 [Adineta vaga]